MKKKIILVLIALLVLFAAVGCGGGQKNASNTEEKNGKKVVYVTAGAMGDNGFTDSTAEGIDRLAADFGADTRVIENNNDAAKFSQSMEAAYQWQPDVIFADAYGFEELFAEYADKYPDVLAVNLDFVLENTKNTITSVTYINEDGSYLAGMLAALVTTSELDKANPEKIVGFVGGNDIPVIRQFEYGFKQGVAAVDPEIQVISSFVGDFFDPIKGKQSAKQLYAQGADIIFQAAGQTGAGILEAAKDENKYAIGVDSNQNGTFPGHVVASMIKDLNNTVYQVYETIEDGTFEAGQHLERGAGVGGTYLIFDENSEAILTQEMMDTIKEAEKKIQDGEITIERYK